MISGLIIPIERVHPTGIMKNKYDDRGPKLCIEIIYNNRPHMLNLDLMVYICDTSSLLLSNCECVFDIPQCLMQGYYNLRIYKIGGYFYSYFPRIRRVVYREFFDESVCTCCTTINNKRILPLALHFISYSFYQRLERASSCSTTTSFSVLQNFCLQNKPNSVCMYKSLYACLH